MNMHASTHAKSMQVRIEHARKYACNMGTEPDPPRVSALWNCGKRVSLAVDFDFGFNRVDILFLACDAGDVARSGTTERHFWLGRIHFRFRSSRGIGIVVRSVWTRYLGFVLLTQQRVTLCRTYAQIEHIRAQARREYKHVHETASNYKPFLTPFFIKSIIRASSSSGNCTASSKLIKSVLSNLCFIHFCKYACIDNASKQESSAQVHTRT